LQTLLIPRPRLPKLKLNPRKVTFISFLGVIAIYSQL
jgi:hypothetical protein